MSIFYFLIGLIGGISLGSFVAAEAITIKALRENERSIEEDYARHLEEWKRTWIFNKQNK